MSIPDREAHWQSVYRTKSERDVSWFEAQPAISLDLIRAIGVPTDAPIVDVGGGTPRRSGCAGSNVHPALASE